MFCKWQVASQAISIGGSGESTLSCKKEKKNVKKNLFDIKPKHYMWDLNIFYEIAILEVSKSQNHIP